MKCTSMFIMNFIHKILTYMFRPKQVGKNIVNKIHNRIRRVFCWLFIYYGFKINFTGLLNRIQTAVTATWYGTVAAVVDVMSHRSS